ncbi:exopolyphosphatase [Heliorestis acidaminivorans]|uniref:Exopolyphosphatase n=1 Tax=Heliorestis acidaminivorans TaxID=553427 RepID=A0A6I0EUG4_9FIRM|nr:exopolyphosphatase [Heliorestis acidaminivorans]KAB2952933.1 exopolyphosphatase [Heliorestis acidaminivorans]
MRLLTRSDFDGLACAVLLKQAGIITSRKFVHPKDMQDGIIEVNENDVIANVPYVPGCGLWFDHHVSEAYRGSLDYEFEGASEPEKSCARVIYNYYGGAEKFPNLGEFVAAVDKADSADFTIDEILNPTGWTLLSFIMDPRTGLGRFKDYRISNYQLMDDLIEYCQTMTIDEIMAVPDIQERIVRYNEQVELFKQMLLDSSTTYNNVLITDTRNVEVIFAGNRFIPYALFPKQNVSIWITPGKLGNTVFAVGYSIINKSCNHDIGKLMLEHGGGGHHKVGTCQVPNEIAEETLEKIKAALAG